MKNYSEREFKDKLDMPLGSPCNKIPDLKKRKDPKSMTTEELEEYINRNKSDKSFNSSFHSQKNLNYSFTGGLRKDKDKEKENESLINNNEVNSKLGGLNYNYLGTSSTSNFNTNLAQGANTNNLNNTSILANTNNLAMNNVNNPFLMNNASNLENQKNNNLNASNLNLNNQSINMPPTSPYAREQLNTQTSNISNDHISDGEDKYLKFKPKQYNVNSTPSLNNSINNFNNSPNKNLTTFNPGSSNTSSTYQGAQTVTQNTNSPSLNSNAASNYLKSLQEKTKFLSQENEELKKNFVEVSEMLEQERSDYQKKLLNEINKTTELEKGLKSEISSLENENKSLVDEVNELRRKLSLLNSNLSILESEKGRHLEQNAVEKENLQNEISGLYQENDDFKKRINSLSNENEILREKLDKVRRDI
jgi:hypothetical protein